MKSGNKSHWQHLFLSAAFGSSFLAGSFLMAADTPVSTGAGRQLLPAENIAPGSPDWPGSPQRRVHETELWLKDEKVARHVLSARDALAYATGKTPVPATLSAEQRRLLQLVQMAQTGEFGREVTRKAAEWDVWYTIDNNGPGGGYYYDRLRLMAIETSDNGSNGGVGRSPVYSHNSIHDDRQFEAESPYYLEVIFHELTHFYQKHIWKIFDEPLADMRSFDWNVWMLSLEAQATIFAQEGMRQYLHARSGAAGADAQFPVPSDDGFRRRFFDDILNHSAEHRRQYEVSRGYLDDGKAIDPAAYAAAFGRMPGRDGNFLEGRIATLEDVYAAAVWPDKELKGYYEAARKRLPVPRPDP